MKGTTTLAAGGDVGVLPARRLAIDQQIDGLPLPRDVAKIADAGLQRHAPAGQDQRLAEVQRGDGQVVVARLAEIDHLQLGDRRQPRRTAAEVGLGRIARPASRSPAASR